MCSRKIMFFDIDGTLTDEKTGEVPEKTKNAIQQAQKLGHLAFVNTGRPISTIPAKIKEIGFDGFVCGCGTYVEYKNEVLYHQTLTKEECRTIVNRMYERKLDGLCEGCEAVFFVDDHQDPTVLMIKEMYINKDHYDVRSARDESLHFDKYTCWFNEESDFESFYELYKNQFEFIYRGKWFREIVPLGTSKATGIQFLLNYFHIDLENCYAFGDSANDLAMLTYVKNSIGMANGEEEVLKRVSFITKSSDDEGIEYALKHFNII